MRDNKALGNEVSCPPARRRKRQRNGLRAETTTSWARLSAPDGHWRSPSHATARTTCRQGHSPQSTNIPEIQFTITTSPPKWATSAQTTPHVSLSTKYTRPQTSPSLPLVHVPARGTHPTSHSISTDASRTRPRKTHLERLELFIRCVNFIKEFSGRLARGNLEANFMSCRQRTRRRRSDKGVWSK